MLLLVPLVSCTAKAPTAQINYLGIKAVGFNYHVKFASDVHILELFSNNRHQRVVFAELVCSMDADHNFDVEHRLKYSAHGGFDLLEKISVSGKPMYVFDADIGFWKASESEMGSDRSLPRDEIGELLKKTAAIPCKVRMTVNFSEPYYSEAFFVPSRDILAAVSTLQIQ